MKNIFCPIQRKAKRTNFDAMEELVLFSPAPPRRYYAEQEANRRKLLKMQQSPKTKVLFSRANPKVVSQIVLASKL
jgi:hypothetical protein